MYNSTSIDLSQDNLPELAEQLSDKGRGGKERPWRAYKMANELLAMAYDDVDGKKADRLRACGKVLTFLVDEYGKKKLTNAESCRVRLCPLCTWRRSLKNFWNTMEIVKWLQEHENEKNVGKYAYIFITLTVKNCSGESLGESIYNLFAAVKRLYERKEVKTAWRGMVRNLEVTHNINPESKDYDTYHPHFHIIAAVRPSYFTSRDYISQARLGELWKHALRADYEPVIDIRRVKGNTSKAVAECSKYAAKAADFIIPEDWDLTVDTVRTLDAALNNRRLINYSGIFREVKQILKLEDVEDGDLVNIGDNAVTDLGDHTYKEFYFWYSGYRQYYKVDV